MKNKLLLTTAIAGLTAITGFAHAETKVSGNMEQTFRSTSVDSGDSGRGLGTEMNIGLSSSKDLDNGLKASYGFNLEFDANAADSTNDVYYMTLSAGDISFSIARDHGQNLSSTVVPHISDQAGTIVNTDVGTTFTNIGSADAHNYDHVRLDSKVAGGTLTLRYAPDSGNNYAGDTTIVDTGKSNSEIIYSGNLGVDGLAIQTGYSKLKADGDANEDTKYKKFGAAYNFGQFAAGASYGKEDAGTVAAKTETEIATYGVTFAANDNLSFGLSYKETELKTAGVKAASDEETILVGVGYNFGGLGIDLNYAQVDNVGNTSGTDAEIFQIRTIQKF